MLDSKKFYLFLKIIKRKTGILKLMKKSSNLVEAEKKNQLFYINEKTHKFLLIEIEKKWKKRMQCPMSNK